MNSHKLIKYFDSIGTDYKTNEYASLFMSHFLRKRLIKKIKNYDDKVVLDIMSGRGENINLLKNYTKIKEITTIDFSKEMNKIAKEKLNKINLIQIENDFFNTDSLSKKYDIILCSFGVKTIKEKDLMCFSKKLSILLNHNGTILILEVVKPSNLYLNKAVKYYTENIVPFVFGKKFKKLSPYIQKHTNLNFLKENLINQNLRIIEHKRYFDLFEIIYAEN
jgi:ubiquinone/menaquinone biosynthesis C-methylase UbiE